MTEQSRPLTSNGVGMLAPCRGVNVEVRPCSITDMDALRRGDVAALHMLHHEERWASQRRQEAVYLLAWHGSEVVGRVTLLLQSRNSEVRPLLTGVAKMNALEARPQGQGIGTALILAGQHEGKRREAPILGLAVEVGNHGARRLYPSSARLVRN
jgi:GNAT superfamily N-acetyltransferase